jgi:hypothetical protein
MPHGIQCAAVCPIGILFWLQVGLEIASSTKTAAVCATLSRIAGTPNGLCFPSGLGIHTRRTGCGRYVLLLSSCVSSSNHFFTPYSSMSSKVWPIYSCCSAVRFATVIGEGHHVFSVHLVVQGIEAKVGRSLALSCNAVCNFRTLSGVVRLIANPRSFVASCVSFQLRLLLSTGVTRLHQYNEPLRHPRRPGLSLASCQLIPIAITAGTSRVARGPHCLHAVANTPAGLMEFVRSYDSISFGLPTNRGGSAPALSVSGPAQRLLNLRPACSPTRLATLCTRGFSSLVASTAALIATGWSEPVPGRV